MKYGVYPGCGEKGGIRGEGTTLITEGGKRGQKLGGGGWATADTTGLFLANNKRRLSRPTVLPSPTQNCNTRNTRR